MASEIPQKFVDIFKEANHPTRRIQELIPA